ncbi:MAG: hypothetical protein M5U09_16760 [Gammaproteobacteria bacterium]|nr:hypothetical protein [Gammaproteobacteria bacterium]
MSDPLKLRKLPRLREIADIAETGASEAGEITEAAESVEAIAAPEPTETAEATAPETGEITDVVETVETAEPPETVEPAEDTDADAGEIVEPTETVEAAPIAQAVETAAAEASAAAPRLDDLGWLYSQSPDAFSIEVTRDAALDEVSRAAAGLSSGSASYAFSSRNGNGLVYNLMVGSFADLIEVQQALGALPSAFENIRIRRLGAVQQEWCGQLDNLTPEQLMLVVDKCARQDTAAQ